ncbi:MAG: DUF5602 domain-containing protein [Rhodocyclaceae bacterium]|nr:DUF5602 domain-containing protein [Rhodocyclaceae bacterium]
MSTVVAVGTAWGQADSVIHTGQAVAIGHGEAYTFVRTGQGGEVSAIGVVLTADVLEGLPAAAPGGDPMFSYHLSMPEGGPRTVIDHVGVDWESVGHPPSQVYDVPHFDFHFYVVSRDAVGQVVFAGPEDSGSPDQQPPARLMPAGYVMPPGTAVPKMGAHAVNPSAPEFQQQPFDATFIYGYYNKELTFVEPMVSLAFLRSRSQFAAPVSRPEAYSRAGAYPSSYRVSYDDARRVYEITLEGLE